MRLSNISHTKPMRLVAIQKRQVITDFVTPIVFSFQELPKVKFVESDPNTMLPPYPNIDKLDPKKSCEYDLRLGFYTDDHLVKDKSSRYVIQYLHEIASCGRFNLDTVNIIACFVQRHKIKVPEEYYLILLNTCAKYGDEKTAEFLFKYLMFQKVPFTEAIIDHVLDMYDRCGMGDKAFALFNDVKSVYHLKQTPSQASTVLTHVMNTKKVAETLKFVIPFISATQDENVLERLWVSLLNAGATSKDSETCHQIQDFMDVSAVPVKQTHKVKNAIIQMYAACGLEENAVELIKTLEVKPNFKTTSFLAEYLVNNLKLNEEALAILSQSAKLSRETITDKITYENMWVNLSNICLELEENQESTELTKKLLKSMVSLNALQTDRIVLNVMALYCKIQSLVDFVPLFDKYKFRIKTLLPIHTMLAAYEKLRRAPDAIDLFNDYFLNPSGKQYLDPTPETFEYLLRCCFSSGYVKESQVIIKKMYTYFEIPATLVHYRIFVRTLIEYTRNLPAIESYITEDLNLRYDPVLWDYLSEAAGNEFEAARYKKTFKRLVRDRNDNLDLL